MLINPFAHILKIGPSFSYERHSLVPVKGQMLHRMNKKMNEDKRIALSLSTIVYLTKR